MKTATLAEVAERLSDQHGYKGAVDAAQDLYYSAKAENKDRALDLLTLTQQEHHEARQVYIDEEGN